MHASWFRIAEVLLVVIGCLITSDALAFMIINVVLLGAANAIGYIEGGTAALEELKNFENEVMEENAR